MARPTTAAAARPRAALLLLALLTLGGGAAAAAASAAVCGASSATDPAGSAAPPAHAGDGAETSLLHLHASVRRGGGGGAAGVGAGASGAGAAAAARWPAAAAEASSAALLQQQRQQARGRAAAAAAALREEARRARVARSTLSAAVWVLLILAVGLLAVWGAYRYATRGPDAEPSAGGKRLFCPDGDGDKKLSSWGQGLAQQAAASPESQNDDGGSVGAKPAKAPQSLEWRDLSFAVGEHRILKGITGLLEPGRVTAVLGPSGSGKTTLLNLLCGRVFTTGPGGAAPLAGEVSLGGHFMEMADLKSRVAYVMQEDHLFAFHTPRECIAFSAHMSRGEAAAEQAELVDGMLAQLGLTKCSGTLVGDSLFKGISGGQRKRVSIGVELVTGPDMVFLDEPLSGLDSYAAYTLVDNMKQLAQSGVLALCTVHQPSSEIFNMFDDVIVLHDGEVMYHGPASDLAAHFERWEKCPPNFNPADHVMFLMQKEGEEGSDKLVEMKEAWRSSSSHRQLDAKIEELRAKPAEAQPSAFAPRKLGFFMQLWALTEREFTLTLRNKPKLAARWGAPTFLASLYSCVFWGVGRDASCSAEHFDSVTCVNTFEAHYAAMIGISMVTMFSSAAAALATFPTDRAIFLREYAAQKYDVAPYFLSKTLIEAPLILIGQTFAYGVAFFGIGLQGNFAAIVAVGWGLGMSISSVSLLMGCGCPTVEMAMSLSPVVLVPQMMFSGLFMPLTSIPAWLQWLAYVCPMRYAINLVALVEFRPVLAAIDGCLADQKAENCESQLPGDFLQEAMLETEGIVSSDMAWNLVVLFVIFLIFRALSAVVLWRKAQYVF